jgi:hypothetical protein
MEARRPGTGKWWPEAALRCAQANRGRRGRPFSQTRRIASFGRGDEEPTYCLESPGTRLGMQNPQHSIPIRPLGSLTYRGSGTWRVAAPCAASATTPPHPDTVRSSRHQRRHIGLRVASPINPNATTRVLKLTASLWYIIELQGLTTATTPPSLTVIGLGWPWSVRCADLVRIASRVGGGRAWARHEAE